MPVIRSSVRNVALLREGVTPQDLNEQFRRSKVTHHYFDRDYNVAVYPMGARLLEKGALPVIALVTGIAGMLILLVALLNFYHLMVGSFLTVSVSSVSGR